MNPAMFRVMLMFIQAPCLTGTLIIRIQHPDIRLRCRMFLVAQLHWLIQAIIQPPIVPTKGRKVQVLSMNSHILAQLQGKYVFIFSLKYL
jgi:hypothetical protein